MARISVNWFEYAGVKSDAMGLRVTALPNRARAAYESEPIKVPGRDGFLYSDNKSYSDVDVMVKVQMTSAASRNLISAWLTGYGLLRFSDQPTLAYRARPMDIMDFTRTDGALARDKLEITFKCHPCLYFFPAEELTLTNGQNLPNPGTYKAEPIIKITGYGDLVLNIGTGSLTIENLGDITTSTPQTIVLNLEARVAYDADDLTVNLGGDVQAEGWPLLIPPGNHTVTWVSIPNDDALTGVVSSVKLIGNWRNI